MSPIKNPSAPATYKQLLYLHQLSGADTRGLKMTKQEASSRIALLEKGSPVLVPPLPADEEPAPFTEAHVTLVEGDQGSGKSGFAVKTIRQAYDKDCVRVFCKEKLKIEVEPLSYSRKNRVAKLKYQGEVKCIHIPDVYKMHSPMRIFSNISLFGIPFVKIPSFAQLLAWIKSGFVSNGWLLIDESHRGMGSRASMTTMGRAWVSEYFQFRKSQLETIIIVHHARMVDMYARMIPTKHIHTEYDKNTHRVTYDVRNKGERTTHSYSFDLREYWANYNTNERVNE